VARATCTIIENGKRCGKPVHGHGWCPKHWQRWRRHGSPLALRRIRGDHERRFWAKVNKVGPVPEHRPELGPCWLWTGYVSSTGYGIFSTEQDLMLAHRFAWKLLVGPIPARRQLDHLCRVRNCVKAMADEDGPAHLEPVTHRENVLRGTGMTARAARKTHCPQGHPYDEANTIWERTVRGRRARRCRICTRRRRSPNPQIRQSSHTT